jgi:hypothetical protein
MKFSDVCRKYSSPKVAAKPSGLGTYNSIKVDIIGFANLTRYICTSCGYMEQYVADDKSLLKLRRRKQRWTMLYSVA